MRHYSQATLVFVRKALLRACSPPAKMRKWLPGCVYLQLRRRVTSHFWKSLNFHKAKATARSKRIKIFTIGAGPVAALHWLGMTIRFQNLMTKLMAFSINQIPAMEDKPLKACVLCCDGDMGTWIVRIRWHEPVLWLHAMKNIRQAWHVKEEPF